MLSDEDLETPADVPDPAPVLAARASETPLREYDWDCYTASYPDLSTHWGALPEYQEDEEWDPEADEWEDEEPESEEPLPKSHAGLESPEEQVGPAYIYQPFAPYLSYRSAACMYFAADELQTSYDLYPGSILQELPPIVERVVDSTWLACFVGSIRDVQLCLAAGFLQMPRSTAEEMALHLILRMARAQMRHLAEHPTTAEIGPWWEPEDDEDTVSEAKRVRSELQRVWESIFEDEDVLMLYEQHLDGVEDSALGEQLKVANLHPSDWFRSFYGEVPTLAQM